MGHISNTVGSNQAFKIVSFAHRASVTPRLLWVALRAFVPQKALYLTGCLTRRYLY